MTNVSKSDNIPTKFLYSNENTKGVYLEDVLTDIIEDVKIKSANIENSTCPDSKIYLESNSRIITLLERAKALQENALRQVKKD